MKLAVQLKDLFFCPISGPLHGVRGLKERWRLIKDGNARQLLTDRQK